MDPEMLEQRAGFERRTFRLGEHDVQVSIKGLVTSKAFSVKYSAIPDDLVAGTSYSRLAFWLMVIFVGLAVFLFGDHYLTGEKEPLGASVFYLFFATVCGIGYVNSRKRLIGFECGDRSLLFFRGRPTEEAVEKFLDAVARRAGKSRQSDLPGQPPTSSAISELERLADLLERGALSEDEYHDLKTAILQSVRPFRSSDAN